MEIEKSKFYINIFLIVFWLRAIFPFISQEILPPLAPLFNLINLLVDITIFGLGLFTIRKRQDVIFLLTFLVVGLLITCYHNNLSLLFYINGLRDFLFLLVIIPIYRYFYSLNKEYFIEKFDKTLYLFLWVQVPCMVWQFLLYGAHDKVGGSLGNWYSGIISTMIYFISFYLLKKKLDPQNFWNSLLKNKIYIFLLFPTFLNETKISFIFLFFYFILLLPIDKKMISRLLVIVPTSILVIIGAFYAYMSATGTKDNLLSLDYYTEMYLFSEETENTLNWAEYLYENEAEILEDIPRFTKLFLISDFNKEYPGHTITGYGVGQFKGGTTIEASKFYTDNEWLLRGTVPYAFHLYIQLGFVGIFFFIWFVRNLLKFKTPNVFHDKGIIIYFFMLIVIIMFYNDSFRETIMSSVLIYIVSQSLNGEITNKDIDTKRLENQQY